MALVRRSRPGWLDLQDLADRFFEGSDDLLRVEEYVEDDNKTLVVRAEAPGLDPDKDVDISVRNDDLHISVRREEKSENKDKDTYRSEFRYGSFQRTVALPAGTTDADINASYSDGVLEIRVPIGPEPTREARKIPVSRS